MSKNKIDIAKLQGLSKEKKLELYDKIQKKKQFEKERRDTFKPHEGQLEVIKSDKKIKFVSAANGWGKSSTSINCLIWAMEGHNPITNKYSRVPCTVVVVLDSPLKVKEVWRKEFSKWYNIDRIQENKHGHPYVTEWVFPNGSRTLFMFHQQEVLAFESIEIDGGVIYDEIPPRHIFVALSRGQRTKNSEPFQLLIGTPTHAAWARTDLYDVWVRGENPDLECFRGTTYQNKENLADGYIESFSRLLTEEEKKIRLEGQFFDLGSLALAHLLKEDIHIVDDFKVPHDWYVIVSIDPHPSKAHTATALAINPRDDQKYVIWETSKKMLAADFAMHLIELTAGLRVVDWVCDSLGSADMTGGEGFKSFIEVLRGCGIKVRPTTYEEKKDEEWIERIRNALAIPAEANNYGEHLPNLQFFRSCGNIVKEIKNVAWVKHKNLDLNKDKLEISNKDYLATLKYALAASTRYNKVVTSKAPIKLGSSNGSKVSIRSRYFKRN